MDSSDYKSLILYYGRERFYHLMQNMSIEAIGKFPSTVEFRLYNGYALALGNRIQEAIRELNPIQTDKELAMGAILGLIYAHKRCTTIDKEALVGLDGRLKDERKRLTSTSAYNAAVFLLLSGKSEKGKEYAEKALRLNRDNVDALVLKGWTELSLNVKANKTTLEIFDQVLATSKNIDANLGQMKYHQLNNEFESAIGVLNKLSIRYPELNIPLVEKMKTQLASWNWDHAVETASRILNLETTNIEALRIKIMVLICRDANFNGAVASLKYLYDTLGKIEPNNCDLYLQIGQLFSRICGRNADVIAQTMKFVEKAAYMSPGNADYTTECGYHCVLLGHYKEAIKYFRAATKLDDSSISALCGLTLCQIGEFGPSEQVVQQIEFLNEIQGPVKNPLLLYMTAKISSHNTDKAIAYLVQACEIQFKNLKTLPYGTEYLRQFNPDFLLQVTTELMQYSPIQSIVTVANTVSKETLHISLKHSLNILEAIVKACPGLIQAAYQLAKVEFLCGETGSSAQILQRILQELDPTFVDAHLLIAQIHIRQEQYHRAAQSLEICLSHNFLVRESAMYHLLYGLIKKNQQQYDDAIKSFLTAMNINNITKLSSPTKMNKKSEAVVSLPTLATTDKVTLYLELMNTYSVMNQTADAAKLMAQAMDEFRGTVEEGRLIIANAELALCQGNIGVAIELLRSIQPGQSYYLLGKTKLAHIYLHHKNDRLSFAQCFKELVDNCPGPESYLMLGDAYMSIQEPDEAIDAFKQALRQNSGDSLLASKLGRAYVKTHQYSKAISYYKEATRNANNSALKLDLAELFLKLKDYSNAEQTLIDEIDSSSKSEVDDRTDLQMRTKQLLLLARIREKAGHLNSSLSTLKEARDNQYRLQKRISVEQSGGMQEQHTILTKICVLMAEQSIGLRDNQQALQHYKEAIKFSGEDLSIMTAIARLYMQMNNMEQCQLICASVLQHDPNNETASVMMADISFRRMDFESASYHFSQLLTAQPTYWTALARLIEVMRRSAMIGDAKPFIQRAEEHLLQPQYDAGLNYCKGLLAWYTGNPNTALRYFNYARRDGEWGQQSIFNMIEICLNPDGDLPSDSTTSTDSVDDIDVNDSRAIALKTAEKLLKELKPRPGGLDNEALNHRLLKNSLKIATRRKSDIEVALSDYLDIASQEEYKEHVGPILGMAIAYILLKQSQRGRNQLKRVAKNIWTFEDAESLERCWLMLADLYTQNGKMDMANELLKRVLDHNKSCVKAYELMGFIAEKDQNYRLASTHYSMAWRYGGQSKPNIGYKLAFNYMKSKNYADAIDVCQQVLKLHPDYPSIKRDILDKCRNNLRS